MPAETPVSPKATSRLPILLSVAAMLLLAALDQTIVATALPAMAADLGGLHAMAWVVTAYLLTATIVAPLYGKFGDLYGRGPVVQVAIAIFLAGSLAAAFAPNMAWLIGARALQGVGGGGLFVLALTVVADIVSPRERGRIQGLFGAVFGLSSIAGPLLGGLFVEHLSWRWVFGINVPLALLAMAVLAVTFRVRTQKVFHRLDWEGALFLALGLAAMVLATRGANGAGPGVPFALGIVFVAALLGLIWAERRAAEPVLPPALFTNRVFVGAVALGTVLGLAMFGAVAFLPLYLQLARGSGAMQSGLQLIPMIFGMLVGSIGAGQFMTRTGRYKLMPILGTLGAAVGFAGLALLDPRGPDWLLYLAMFVAGLGLGPLMSVITTAIQNAVPRPLVGAATAASTMFRQIGGSFGVALFGTLFALGLQAAVGPLLPAGTDLGALGAAEIAALPAIEAAAVRAGFAAALQPVFVAAAIAALVGFGLALALKEIPLRSEADADTAPAAD